MCVGCALDVHFLCFRCAFLRCSKVDSGMSNVAHIPSFCFENFDVRGFKKNFLALSSLLSLNHAQMSAQALQQKPAVSQTSSVTMKPPFQDSQEHQQRQEHLMTLMKSRTQLSMQCQRPGEMVVTCNLISRMQILTHSSPAWRNKTGF